MILLFKGKVHLLVDTYKLDFLSTNVTFKDLHNLKPIKRGIFV